MENYLTIAEAVKLTGKSQITIRRWIKEMISQSPTQAGEFIIKSKVNEFSNSPFVYKIRLEKLLESFPQSNTQATAQDTTQTSRQTENDNAQLRDELIKLRETNRLQEERISELQKDKANKEEELKRRDAYNDRAFETLNNALKLLDAVGIVRKNQ